jgi:hypothetical protein
MATNTWIATTTGVNLGSHDFHGIDKLVLAVGWIGSCYASIGRHRPSMQGRFVLIQKKLSKDTFHADDRRIDTSSIYSTMLRRAY